MGDQSKIQWTEATWNPWHGCKKVSAGCKYCYMYRDKEKYGQDPTVVMRSKTKFGEPLKWKQPRIIFTCSWSDWFIDEADAWRDEAWAIIKATPQHTYQILTKRPERILEHLPADWGDGYPNVWIGVSVEDQAQARKRIPLLQQIPAAVRFLSCEPLLERLFLMYHDDALSFLGIFNLLQHIHWVIVGGESGNETGDYRYRECHYSWIRSIINECYVCNVPVFVKQLGTHLSKEFKLKDRHGGNMDEWPDEPLRRIKIREFPKLKITENGK